MTPAINCLKKAKIKYQVHQYDHDPESNAYGEEAVEKLNTIIDSPALKFNTVYVSAGRRGLHIELSPKDLGSLTNAIYDEISCSDKE